MSQGCSGKLWEIPRFCLYSCIRSMLFFIGQRRGGHLSNWCRSQGWCPQPKDDASWLQVDASDWGWRGLSLLHPGNSWFSLSNWFTFAEFTWMVWCALSISTKHEVFYQKGLIITFLSHILCLEMQKFHGHVSGLKVQPVDTTGAGDAFCAGLLSQIAKSPALVEV